MDKGWTQPNNEIWFCNYWTVILYHRESVETSISRAFTLIHRRANKFFTEHSRQIEIHEKLIRIWNDFRLRSWNSKGSPKVLDPLIDLPLPKGLLHCSILFPIIWSTRSSDTKLIPFIKGLSWFPLVKEWVMYHHWIIFSVNRLCINSAHDAKYDRLKVNGFLARFSSHHSIRPGEEESSKFGTFWSFSQTQINSSSLDRLFVELRAQFFCMIN